MTRLALVATMGVAWIGSLACAVRGDENPAGGLQFCPVERVEKIAFSPEDGQPSASQRGDQPSDTSFQDKSVAVTALETAAGDEQPQPQASSDCPCCCERKPWHLPQPLGQYGIHISGWLEQGYTYNDDNPKNHINGPVACNDHDEYQMNQLWLAFERPVKTDGCGFDVGGRIDMLLGTDWRFGINHGLEDRINGFNGQYYGMVLPQCYGEVGWNDLTVKVGHMASILDYEIVAAPGNPFYSHSYSYPYGTPVLVTGWLADYKVTEQFSVQGGMHRGWMEFEDNNEKWDFMGGFRFRTRDGRTTIAYAITNGPQDPAGQHNRFASSLVVTEKLTDRLQYVLVNNLGVEDAAAVGGGQAEWGSICQYLLYTINPKWSANLRTELFRDEDGARVAGPGNIPGVDAWTGRGFAGNFCAVTGGLNWRPQANMLLRPEIRYDWYSGHTGFDDNHPAGGALPFGDGNHSSQLLAACDFILMF